MSARQKHITEAGLPTRDGREHEAPNREQVRACKAWVSEWVTPRKSINRQRDSYGLKDDVERWHGSYISNGAFIQAAVECGYVAERISPDCPNARFNMSYVKWNRAGRPTADQMTNKEPLHGEATYANSHSEETEDSTVG